MPAKKLVAASPLVLALIATGCGSSSKTPTTPATHSMAGPSPSAALITTKSDKKLGTILASGPKKLTVYLFERDKGGMPTCTGACAQVWPPVTGTPKAAGAANSSDFGTVKTASGQTQVTYKGHPLYRYAKDEDAEDAYGQGLKSFGASWYALKPSGQKVDLS